jgi:hypothetical protein
VLVIVAAGHRNKDIKSAYDEKQIIFCEKGMEKQNKIHQP